MGDTCVLLEILPDNQWMTWLGPVFNPEDKKKTNKDLEEVFSVVDGCFTNVTILESLNMTQVCPPAYHSPRANFFPFFSLFLSFFLPSFLSFFPLTSYNLSQPSPPSQPLPSLIFPRLPTSSFHFFLMSMFSLPFRNNNKKTLNSLQSFDMNKVLDFSGFEIDLTSVLDFSEFDSFFSDVMVVDKASFGWNEEEQRENYANLLEQCDLGVAQACEAADQLWETNQTLTGGSSRLD